MRAAGTVRGMGDVRVGWRRFTRWLIWGNAALVVLVLVLVVVLVTRPGDGGVGQLRARDPHGATACKVLRDWAAGRLNGTRVEAGVAAGGEAAQASTATIQATAGPVGAGSGLHAANLTQLRTACIAAGVQVDALPAP